MNKAGIDQVIRDALHERVAAAQVVHELLRPAQRGPRPAAHDQDALSGANGTQPAAHFLSTDTSVRIRAKRSAGESPQSCRNITSDPSGAGSTSAHHL